MSAKRPVCPQAGLAGSRRSAVGEKIRRPAIYLRRWWLVLFIAYLAGQAKPGVRRVRGDRLGTAFAASFAASIGTLRQRQESSYFFEKK